MLSFQLQKSPTPNFEEKCGNSTDISKGSFRSGMCKFESSQVSQPVPVAKRLPPKRPERPTISGLLQFKGRSPRSRMSKLRVEVAESLRPPARIFPFSRDWSRRLGSIITVWRSTQSHLDLFLPPPRGNWEYCSLNAASFNLSGGLLGEACNV